MILKIKAKIYQYTGIYLAQKEEDAYVDWALGTDFDGYEKSLAIGLWQAKNGFTSMMPRNMRRFRISKLEKIKNRLEIIWLQLKDDLWIVSITSPLKDEAWKEKD
jgi:hypothetical protein